MKTAQNASIIVEDFGGLKNDEDPKQVDFKYFVNMSNFNFPNTALKGVAQILCPSLANTIGSSVIDGLFEYKYLNLSNVLTTEYIAVTNGVIYKGATTTEVVLKSGLTTGKCSFAVYNDKLFISNGKDNVNIYYGALGVVAEMGSPVAKDASTAGNPNGAYYYALTYVTTGGEEVIGSVSNTLTVSSSKITLTLPLGYSGTTSRKLYRTDAGGSDLKLVATIADNTTTTYLDDTADGALGAAIPATNNALPKPYHLGVANQALYGVKVDMYPTQAFKTDTSVEVWDLANFIDVANYGNDNTPLVGLGIDFSKVVVGSERNIYILDWDSDADVTSVRPTRANVGMKSGYTVQRMPSFANFVGGLIFASSLNDIRMITGVSEIPVVTVIDNITTQNWGQNIRKTLDLKLKNYTYIDSAFYDNRYFLAIDGIKYIFDIRTQGWSRNYIKTTSYVSYPVTLEVMNDLLYNGQDDGEIELEYQTVQYKSEDIIGSLKSGYLDVSKDFKFINKLVFWITISTNCTLDISVITDDNITYPVDASLTLTGSIFDPVYYNSMYFSTTGESTTIYRIVNINRMCRWLYWNMSVNTGNVEIKRVELHGQKIRNKEV